MAAVADEPDSAHLAAAARCVRDGVAYMSFPRERWRRIRMNNVIERFSREVRYKTRVVGTFPDGKLALMLVAARIKYVFSRVNGGLTLPRCLAAGRVAMPRL